jgi:hypothetical protein
MSGRRTEDVFHNKSTESLQHQSARSRLPAHKFLLAAMMAIHCLPPDTPTSHKRFDTLSTVTLFIRRWDRDCLGRTDVGTSKLAESLPRFFTYVPPATSTSETKQSLADNMSIHGLTLESYEDLRHQLGFDVSRSVRDL